MSNDKRVREKDLLFTIGNIHINETISRLTMFNITRIYKSFLLLREKENTSESRNMCLAVSIASMVHHLFCSLACLWVKTTCRAGEVPSCRATTILVAQCDGAPELRKGCCERTIYCKKHECRNTCKTLWAYGGWASNWTCEGTRAGADSLKCPASVHSVEDLDFIPKLMKISL